MVVYYDGKYSPKEEVAISPDDRGFLLADGVYDVIRSYQGKLFKCREHLERLERGLKELRIKGVETNGLETVAQQLVRENKLEGGNALVYIQVTRGVAVRCHAFPPPETMPTIYVEANAYSSPTQMQENGAKAILAPDQRWSRCDIKAIGLLANVLASQKAREAGAFEAIFYADGLLQEGTHSSILFVKKDVVICPPLTNRILPSVTRSVVIGLAATESIDVEIRPCREGELSEFDEILMVGTGSEIIPITAVHGQKVRHGYPGPVAKRLQGAFRRLVHKIP